MTLDELEDLREELLTVAAKYSEHFTGFQILASAPIDGGGTMAVKVGAGDWFSRRGLAQAFLEEAQADIMAIRAPAIEVVAGGFDEEDDDDQD